MFSLKLLLNRPVTIGLLGMPGLVLGCYVLQLSLTLVVPVGSKQEFLNSENV